MASAEIVSGLSTRELDSVQILSIVCRERGGGRGKEEKVEDQRGSRKSGPMTPRRERSAVDKRAAAAVALASKDVEEQPASQEEEKVAPERNKIGQKKHENKKRKKLTL